MLPCSDAHSLLASLQSQAEQVHAELFQAEPLQAEACPEQMMSAQTMIAPCRAPRTRFEPPRLASSGERCDRVISDLNFIRASIMT